MEQVATTLPNRSEEGSASRAAFSMNAGVLHTEPLTAENLDVCTISETSRLYCALKRLLDIVLSIVGIVFLSPLLLFIAVCIKLDDGVSVIHFREIIGKHGK